MDKAKEIKIFVCCTSGGHLTEAIDLFKSIPGVKLVAATNNDYREIEGVKLYVFKNFKNSFLRYLVAFFDSFMIIVRERPKWTVTTGAQHGVVAMAAAKVLFCKTIFVETVTRYTSATKSAKLSYHIADHFYVQNPECLELFGPKAKYIGGLL